MEEKRPWIERTLRRLRESEAELPPARLEDGGEVPYLGERLELRVHVQRGRVRATSPGGGDTAVSALDLPARDGPAPALERWYRQQRASRGGAAARRGHCARGHELQAPQIRGQRTRWASLLDERAR